jgi:hypothetical protein
MSRQDPSGSRVLWTAIGLVVVAGVIVVGVVVVKNMINRSDATPKAPNDVYIAALLDPAPTDHDPLYALAQNNPESAIALGNAACAIMRADIASNPSLYDDSAELLKDVERQLAADARWTGSIQVAGIPFEADFDNAAGAAARQGSLCPEFGAELSG